MNAARRHSKPVDPEAFRARLSLSPEDLETLRPLENQMMAEAMSGRVPKMPVLTEKEKAALGRFARKLDSKER